MKKEELRIVRTFNAPREMVFDAFSKAEALVQWWGPANMTMTVQAFDFNPKGKFHFKLHNPEAVMWAVFTYERIVRPELIEFINSFSDEKGTVCRADFSADWPLEVFNEVRFEENKGITTLTFKAWPIHATAEEENMFRSFAESMNQGFGATFDALQTYLNKTKN